MDTPTTTAALVKDPAAQAIAKVEAMHGRTNAIRDQMLAKLTPMIEAIEIHPQDGAMMVQAKMGVLGEMRSLLKELDSTAHVEAKLHLTQKHEENNQAAAAGIADLLRGIHLASPKDAEASAAQLAAARAAVEAVAATAAPIPESELACG